MQAEHFCKSFNHRQNSRQVQIDSICRRRIKDARIAVQIVELDLIYECLKTLWEKEKMLVTCIFSFSHDVFKASLSILVLIEKKDLFG